MLDDVEEPAAMTYAARESSDHDAQPVELYRFTEAARKWLYTSADAAVVYQTETYEPRPLKRGAFRQTSELNKATLEINAPRDLPLVADAFASPLVGVIALTIYRQHRGDGETVTWWKGRVAGIRASGGETTITCEPLATALKRIGLRRPAQRQCPHALYDAGCTVSQAAFSATGTLVSLTGATVTAGAFATKPDGWWVGGKIILNGVPRFVIGHAGDTVAISAPVPGLPQNATFTVYAGCDRTPATCDSKFGNILNFGGAPWFPIKNPFTGDSAA
jgi:uncharacterized phage protein (TIGR02218 family)